jgi:hypothetical protein
MLAAIAAGTVKPALIAEIQVQGGYVRAWSGIGDLIFGGETYTGVGNFGGVSPVKESSDLQSNGCQFILSGIPSGLVSSALGSLRYGRTAKLWFGILDSSDALIEDPYLLFSGLTDNAQINEGADTSSITVTAESRMVDLDRPRSRRYTTEDQQIDYPTDKGFDFVPSLQDKPIVIGKP